MVIAPNFWSLIDFFICAFLSEVDFSMHVIYLMINLFSQSKPISRFQYDDIFFKAIITQFDGTFQHQTHQLGHDPSKMYMKYILHTKYLPIRHRRLNCAGFCQICQAVIMWSIISLFLIFSWQLVLIHLFINCQFYMQSKCSYILISKKTVNLTIVK